jgi:hypothetical protein
MRFDLVGSDFMDLPTFVTFYITSKSARALHRVSKCAYIPPKHDCSTDNLHRQRGTENLCEFRHHDSELVL